MRWTNSLRPLARWLTPPRTARGQSGTRHEAPAAGVRALVTDGVSLGLLLLLLALLTGYVVTRPAMRLAFTVDQPPPEVSFTGFYGLERNASFAFRWSKPDAAITIPVNQPGTYAIELTLADGSPVQPPRSLTVSINGVAQTPLVLKSTPRNYAFQYEVPPGNWRFSAKRDLTIVLRAPAYVPAGDPRALGVVVSGVSVTPAERLATWRFTLALTDLALLATVYLALRASGFSRAITAGVLGAGLGLYALLALAAPGLALLVAFVPRAEPIGVAGLALLLASLPAVARAWSWPAAPDRPATAPAETARGRLARWLDSPWALLPVTILALGLRLYHLTRLSLWLDEGFTVFYSRFSWPALLGLRGQYDVHPPLYYALVKLVAPVLSDEVAGRAVSAVAGTLTVVVLYRLAALLAGPRVALVAALVLALSPLHVWYSQEGRMYALAVLLVTLSYLALIELAQGGSRWWLAVYGAAALLALYTDFSAIFPLAPQPLCYPVLWRRDRWRATGVALALALAILAFVPWVLAAFSRVGAIASDQSYFLGATWPRVGNSLLALAGISGHARDSRYSQVTSYYWGDARTPWDRWPALHPLLILVAVALLAGGVWWLWRRAAPGLLVALLLGAGTLGTAILVSLVSPGYADRTVLYAVPGWALVTGAAARVRRPRWLSAATRVSAALLLLLTSLSLVGIARGATKLEDYRALAGGAAEAARSGLPVLVSDELTATMIELYQPGVTLVRPPLDQVNGRLPTGVASANAFWYVYADFAWMGQSTVKERFASDGFRLVCREHVRDVLYLDLYARQTVSQPPSCR